MNLYSDEDRCVAKSHRPQIDKVNLTGVGRLFRRFNP